MKKRILSLLLVIVMLLGVMPTIALAEEATTEPTVYTIDFKQFAADAATQTWWADLKQAATENVEGAWAGYFTAAMTETEAAAYDSMIQYMKDNYNWYLDETATALKTVAVKKGFWMSPDSTATWGMSFFSSILNSYKADFAFVVDVEKAGLYQLDMTTFYEGLTGGIKINQFTGGNDGGAGYVDLLVNGDLVVDDYCTFGKNDAETGINNLNATLTETMATVALNAGENTITVRPSKDLNGAESSHRRYINLQSITLTETECTHETIEGHYCAVCGALAEGHYVIDFKQFAADAAQQDWFQEFTPAATVAGAFAGFFTAAMTTEQAAAYDSMIQYQKDNYGWYLDEDATGLKTTAKKKGFWMSPDTSAPWGVSMFSSDLNKAAGDFAFVVDVAEEGLYAIDLVGYYEGLTGAVKINQFTGGNDAGAGYIDVLVNGETILDDHKMMGQGEAYQNNLQTKVIYATLDAGENTITIRPALDCNGVQSSHRRYVAFESIGLAKMEECTHPEYANGICSVCAQPQLNDEGVFEIGTEAELLAFSKAVSKGWTTTDAVLTADVALTSAWITNLTVNNAIGTATNAYAGTFDGAGYTISGIAIAFNNNYAVLGSGSSGADDNARDFRLGLFGTTDGATIKNLTVEGSVTMAGRQSAVCSIAGLVATASNTTIENCFNKVALTGKSSGGWNAFHHVGGLVGYADTVSITKSGNEVDLLIDARYLGGLVGRIAVSAEPTIISDCYNLGDLDGVREVGGLVGQVGGCTTEATPTTITNCYSYGDFSNHYMSGTEVKYDANYCGGLFGTADAATEEYSLYTVISNLFLSGSTNTVIPEGVKNATSRSWPGNSTPVRENIWYEAGKGVAAYTFEEDYNYWGGAATAEQLANPDFVRTMGGNLVLINGDTLPKLAWQHEHTDVAGFVYNNDLTHTASTLCEGCSYAVATAEPEFCIDADDNTICDVCENEIICKHLRTTTVIEALEDGTHNVLTFCASCEELQSTENVECSDAEDDEDVVCDVCDAIIPCKHAETTTGYVDNGNGTHDVVVTCNACSEEISTETADCVDEDEDGYCDACEATIVTEPECDHSNTTSESVSNGDKTHTTTVTCECGEVVSTETVACTDEDKDCLCDVCGATIKEITKITVVGANMTLGNDLKMNFMVNKADMKEGYVAMVSQAGAEPVALELWSYNAAYYAASYSVAAKEMTDVLSVEIYDADGYLVSNPFTRTVKQYAMTLLNNASQKASLKSVIVDMLNYGTEAQKYFHHNEDAYANAEVTAEQQETYATKEVECVNNQQGGTNFVGANLSLEDSILLNVFFRGITNGDLTGVTATVSFTDYLGNEVTADAEIGTQGSAMVKVVVNQIVLADAKRPVTVTVYKDGAMLGTGVESVESYIARNLSNASTGALNMAIMKFSASAYAHLGGTN